MISFLATVYDRWPLRTHCSPERHVLLCRLITPRLNDKPCPKPRPPMPGVADKHPCDPGRPWPPR
jgi:hypothetical protein